MLTEYYSNRLKHHTHDSIVCHKSLGVRGSKGSPRRQGSFPRLIAKVIDNHHGTAYHDFRNSYFTLVKLRSTF